MDFPTSPTVGTKVSAGSKVWEWNGAGWALLGSGIPVGLTPVAVTAATTTNVACATASNFLVAMGTNITTLNLNSPNDGQTINMLFTQDATGSRTVAWPASFKWPNGTAPALSTAANARDMLTITWFNTPGIWVASLMRGLL